MGYFFHYYAFRCSQNYNCLEHFDRVDGYHSTVYFGDTIGILFTDSSNPKSVSMLKTDSLCVCTVLNS